MADQSNIRNQLLARLSAEDFSVIGPKLEPVELRRSFEMAAFDREVEYCYFIDSGIGSVIAVSPEQQKAEVGIVGREGLSPIAPVLGLQSAPYEYFMQVSGHGHRIKVSHLQQAMAESPHILEVFLRYAQVLSIQASYTALSNAIHHIDERLARWILMCDDRADNGTIALTHEFLSIMLAVRRPSVTTALHVLEGNGFIYSDRGLLTVRNRSALEAFAGDAYGIPEQAYRNAFGEAIGAR